MSFGQSDDTIAAVASAPGGAARGIVRVTGAECVSALSALFRPESDQFVLTNVRLPQRVAGSLELGQPLGRVPADLLLWPGTRSYTRQPSAEIHTQGSPPLLEAILARLCEHGARIARPGEFTLRAFLAGRIDLTQAEAVLGVIDARSQRDLSAALAQLAGGLAGPLTELRNRLLDLLAHLEAGLDFVDEDIEFISRDELLRQLDDAAQRIDALTRRMQRRGITRTLPRIVLTGPPNVGKSSLFNALCGGESAIVSPVAGTTRDYVSRQIRCGDIDVELIDTAGVDPVSAVGAIDAAAQVAAVQQAQQATLVVECRETSQPFSPVEQGTLRVYTKCDQAAEFGDDGGAILTSGRTGQGIVELKQAIEAALASESDDECAVAETAARCRESLFHAAEALHRARQAAVPLGEEFIAAEIRLALDDVGRVVGAVYTEDVLDRIFSRFCIGK